MGKIAARRFEVVNSKAYQEILFQNSQKKKTYEEVLRLCVDKFVNEGKRIYCFEYHMKHPRRGINTDFFKTRTV